MKTIPLTQGQIALVDDEDYASASEFKWCAHKSKGGFYAARNVQKEDGSRVTLHLHRFLLPSSPYVDHKDGNGLNNQRYNLRTATVLQNNRGFRRKKADTTSHYRGVSWDSNRKKWFAQGKTAEGKTLFLGRFLDEKEAACTYDNHARKTYGEFACPNFP